MSRLASSTQTGSKHQKEAAELPKETACFLHYMKTRPASVLRHLNYDLTAARPLVPPFLVWVFLFFFLKFVIYRIFSDKLEEQSLGEATGSGRKSDAVVFDHLDLDPWVFVQSTDWIGPSSKEVATTRGIQGRRDGTVPLLHTVLCGRSVRNPRVP